MRRLVGMYVDKAVGGVWVASGYVSLLHGAVHKTTFCTQFIRTFHQVVYTCYLRVSHLLVGRFSPVSTPPTTSTILYKKRFIINEGGAV